MGFESFQIGLQGGRKNNAEAINAVMRLPGAVPDEESILTPGSKCFLVNDGNHAIELEVMEGSGTISCRFTLCHPPTVDAAFIALVKKLMETLDMRVKILDELEPGQPREFTLATFADFARIVPSCIAKRRDEWKAAFGNQTLGATTVQVHEKIVAAYCQSNVEKAG